MIIVPSNVSAAPKGDLYWDYTSLLLTAGDGTGSTNSTFLDSSANNLTVTRFGDATQGLVSPVSGGGSAYFDGSGDRLEIPSSTGFAFGTGNYCIELWVRPDAWPSGNYVPLIRTIGGAKGFLIGNHAGNLLYHIPNVGDVFTAPLPTVGVWSHIAVCRNGTTVSMFVNGIRVATATNSHNHVAANLAIGGSTDWNTYSKGHISGVRIVKGNSIYDPTQTNLTVPTEPLTAIPGTSLLLNMNNASIVDRTVKNTLAVFGDAQASAVQTKFASRSIYFDGTGDYLYSASNTVNNFGTGDFTVEAWVYPQFSGPRAFLSSYTSPGGFWLRANSSAWDSGTGDEILVSGGTVSTGWSHVAVCRSGTTQKLFVNGVQVASNAGSTFNFLSTPGTTIGALQSSIGQWFSGYIDSIRVTKGVARYTANFTPPTKAFPVGPYTGPLVPLNGAISRYDGNSYAGTGTSWNDAIGANTAELIGTPTYVGQGFIFNGSNQYARIARQVSGDYSLACWFKTTSTAGTQGQTWYQQPALVNCEIGGVTNDFGMTIGNGEITFGVRNDTATLRSPIKTYNDGQWHLAVATREIATGTHKLYIDGANVASATGGSTIPSTAPTYIGIASNGHGGQLFNGQIGAVWIGDEVFTAKAIDSLYKKGPVAYTGPLTPLTATGGTVTEADGYRIHTFTSSGTFTVSSLGTDNTLEYLVVGGGGGGAGGGGGGGGGAGGLLTGSTTAAAQGYSVTVGAGGAGGTQSAAGTNGSNSSVFGLTAVGGGGGGWYTSLGKLGGSGGGSAGSSRAGGAGTAGQGNAGGNGRSEDGIGRVGAGGGGAGAAGQVPPTTNTGGAGGDGVQSSITGTAVWYAGGGGGGPHVGTGGAGGQGGGGRGADGQTARNGSAGAANTGGGGGGAGNLSPDTGYAGGSGIVIVRYRITA